MADEGFLAFLLLDLDFCASVSNNASTKTKIVS